MPLNSYRVSLNRLCKQQTSSFKQLYIKYAFILDLIGHVHSLPTSLTFENSAPINRSRCPLIVYYRLAYTAPSVAFLVVVHDEDGRTVSRSAIIDC